MQPPVLHEAMIVRPSDSVRTSAMRPPPARLYYDFNYKSLRPKFKSIIQNFIRQK